MSHGARLIMSMLFAAGVRMAFAVEPETKGSLAGLPSAPGPQLEKIKALGDNAWLNLGKPAPDPKFGAAIGRSWSRKMAFAPDLHGAFLFGAGVHHGSTLRNGRKYFNDDLYFYDINAHAWVCCHPGTPLNADGSIAAEIKVDPATGLNVDKDGNVIPVATSVHAYWTPEYDTDLNMFMFVPSTDPFGFLVYDAQAQRYSMPANYSSPWESKYSPYYYDGRTGKFERRVAAPGHSKPGADTAVFYSHKLKKAVYFNNGVWLYDCATNNWKMVNAEGGGNGAYCHDAKRDLVYVVRGQSKRNEKGEWVSAGPNLLSIYDLGANTWSQPKTEGDPGTGMESNDAFFTYDTVNDVAVFHISNQHHVYDPKTTKWAVPPSTLPEKVNWVAGSGFYDPELDAHFYFNAGDSDTEPGNMWVYRYARGGK